MGSQLSSHHNKIFTPERLKKNLVFWVCDIDVIVHVSDLQKNYSEIPEEERHDAIPEFWEGHNIADYIDPEIFEVSNYLLFYILLY